MQAWRASFETHGQFLSTERPFEPEPLRRGATEVADEVEQLLALDMFCDARNAKKVAQADHRSEQSSSIHALLRGRDEAAIELDLIEA